MTKDVLASSSVRSEAIRVRHNALPFLDRAAQDKSALPCQREMAAGEEKLRLSKDNQQESKDHIRVATDVGLHSTADGPDSHHLNRQPLG